MDIKRQVETIRKRHQIQKILNQNGLFAVFNTDAEEDWVTINGTHVLIDENGVAQSGGKLSGMTFSNAKSTKKTPKNPAFSSALKSAKKNPTVANFASALKEVKVGDSIHYTDNGMTYKVKKLPDNTFQFKDGSAVDGVKIAQWLTMGQKHGTLTSTKYVASKPQSKFESEMSELLKQNNPFFETALKGMGVGDSFSYKTKTGTASVEKTGDNEYVYATTDKKTGETQKKTTTVENINYSLWADKETNGFKKLASYTPAGETSESKKPETTSAEQPKAGEQSDVESAMSDSIKSGDAHKIASALKKMKTGDSFSYEVYGKKTIVKKNGDDSYDYKSGEFIRHLNKPSKFISQFMDIDKYGFKKITSYTHAKEPEKETVNKPKKPTAEPKDVQKSLQDAFKNATSANKYADFAKAMKDMKVGDICYFPDSDKKWGFVKLDDDQYFLKSNAQDFDLKNMDNVKNSGMFSKKTAEQIASAFGNVNSRNPLGTLALIDRNAKNKPATEQKKKPLTQKAKEWATRFTQEAKDKAKWFTNKSGGYAAAKEYFSPVSESVYEKATKPQLAAEMEYTGTGSYYMNRVLAGFNGSYDMSDYKGYGGIDIDSSGYGTHIRQLTNLIKKSKYDHDVWLNSCQSYGWLNGLLGYQNEDITKMSDKQLQSYVGSTAKIPGFVSASIDKEKKFKSSPEVVANIYAPKGSEMFYTTRGEYGYAEHEMILQRGGSYKITKLEWGKNKYGKKCLYADLEIHPEDGYDTFQQTKKKS